jgi:hypothetical protein
MIKMKMHPQVNLSDTKPPRRRSFEELGYEAAFNHDDNEIISDCPVSFRITNKFVPNRRKRPE